MALFLDSISNNLDESTRIGMGHSLGGTLLLYHAIQHPGRWDTIFIVEPALFSPSVIWLYRLIRLLYLEDYLHPMIRLTKKRKDTFDSRHWYLNDGENEPCFNTCPMMRCVSLLMQA